MSMFSGLTNQISGWVANKTGQGADPNAPQDPNAAPVDPNDPNYAQNGAEVPVDPNDPNAQGQGGMAGMAQGFLAKAMAAKDGLKDKASAFQPPNLGAVGGGVMGNVMNMIPGQRREEEVPDPNAQQQMMDPNQQMMDPNQQMVDPNQYQQYDQTQYQQ